MKLWQKEGLTTAAFVERFTVGRDRELDPRLAEHDLLASLAHATMLAKVGLITSDDLALLKPALLGLLPEAETGAFALAAGVEDVHSEIERRLTEQLGETGEKVHAGRSRNDQVLVALRLYYRAQIEQTATAVRAVFDRLQALSEQHKGVRLPGFTHLQVAMPSSFGLWFGAYAESLADDMHLLAASWQLVNKNPLGSAAGYGSSLPLDRELTAHLLGFEGLNWNVVYAQMTRGKVERVLSQALAAVAATLSRLAMDVCLYVSQPYGFIRFPAEVSTGSSIMPHKQNPDPWELIRGRCNVWQAVPTQFTLLTTNLPSGYHREMQLSKELLLPAWDELLDCLAMADYMLQHIIVNPTAADAEIYRPMYSVEAVNALVKSGVSFREAYRRVGAALKTGPMPGPDKLEHTHQGSLGNLGTSHIAEAMHKAEAGFGFEAVRSALTSLRSQ
jgi:argininosuccinate lyase